MAFIDDHRGRFGVKPIWCVLTEHGIKIAPGGYRPARNRAPSSRAVRDEQPLAEIKRIYHDRQRGRRLYGAGKM